MKEITQQLFSLQDLQYRDFHAGLMPDIDKQNIIGVRMPDIRKLAKQIAGEAYIDDFLNTLPHRYYEENNLHAVLLSLKYKDIDTLLGQIELFLPYVDNWATCDMMSPKGFKKDLDKVYGHICRWLQSNQTYTVRFAIVTLMGFYLNDAFSEKMPQKVASVSSEEYYVKMAVAWYFSTALAKQYDAVLPYIERQRLDTWTHNKAIQKAIESRRITPERKEYLKSLKVKS